MIHILVAWLYSDCTFKEREINIRTWCGHYSEESTLSGDHWASHGLYSYMVIGSCEPVQGEISSVGKCQDRRGDQWTEVVIKLEQFCRTSQTVVQVIQFIFCYSCNHVTFHTLSKIMLLYILAMHAESDDRFPSGISSVHNLTAVIISTSTFKSLPVSAVWFLCLCIIQYSAAILEKYCKNIIVIVCSAKLNFWTIGNCKARCS